MAGCNRLLNHKFATASSSAIGVDSITSFADAATHSDDTAPRGDLDEDEDKDRLLVPPNTAVSTSDSDAGVEWRLEGTLTPAAIAISQDGWSYPSSYLDSFPDPSLAHARRGTHWTYDGPAYAAFVSALRQPLSAHQPSTLSFSGGIVSNNGETDVHDLSLIYAPTSTSSHRGGDPVCQPQPILPAHRIILIEGPYTLLDQGAFSQAARLLDERWVLECSESVAMDRIVSKHVESRHLGNEEGVRRTAKDNYMPSEYYQSCLK